MGQSQMRYIKRHRKNLKKEGLSQYVRPACQIQETLMEYIDCLRSITDDTISFEYICESLKKPIPSEWFRERFHEYALSSSQNFKGFLKKTYSDDEIIKHMQDLYVYGGIFTRWCLFMAPAKPTKPFSEYDNDEDYLYDIVTQDEDFHMIYDFAVEGKHLSQYL